jgi:DNA-binding MarR family transcriptional regulator
MSQFEIREDGLLSEKPVSDLAAWYSTHCPEADPLVFEAQFMLLRTHMAVKLMAPFDLRRGVTEARYNVLRSLAQTEDGRLKMTDIVQCMNVSPTNITKLVDQLVNDGYVRRLPDATDKRKFWVELTASGREVLEEMIPLVSDSIRGVWEGISEQEMRLLIHLLARVRMNVLTRQPFSSQAKSLADGPG